jgi:hypothetical protein
MTTDQYVVDLLMPTALAGERPSRAWSSLMTTSIVQLDLAAALADAEGQLMPASRRGYRIDAEQFAPRGSRL